MGVGVAILRILVQRFDAAKGPTQPKFLTGDCYSINRHAESAGSTAITRNLLIFNLKSPLTPRTPSLKSSIETDKNVFFRRRASSDK